jgi:hypothetical protein
VKFKGTLQLLSYTEDVNLLRDDIDNIKEITDTLIDASREVGLELNAEITCVYVAVSSPYCRVKLWLTDRKWIFLKCAHFLYLGTTVTYQNLI